MKKIDKKAIPFYLRWLAPDYWALSVSHVDFAELARTGTETIVFDIDSTLAMRQSDVVDEKVLHAIAEAREFGSIHSIAIATNRSSFDFPDIVHQLGPEVVYVFATSFLESKPFSGFYKNLFNQVKSRPGECVMIGDKLFTDILGARRSGMRSVHVERLGRDGWFDRLIQLRRIERFVARKYRE